MNYIDLHCDTISELYHKNLETLADNTLQVSLPTMQRGHTLLQCFAIFVNLKKTDTPFEDAIMMIERYYHELEENKEAIAPVYTYQDVEKTIYEGKISALLTLEEGAVTLGKLELLNIFYRLGVRMICLNWNFENGIGHPNFQYDGHTMPDFKTPNIKDGLTDYGKKMVQRMNELGIIVDVSHLSDKGFYDCIELSTKPIVASHSNARAVCNNVRNLTDDMIVKLSQNGGVMGINFCADFLAEDGGENTIDWVIKHMLHVKELVGCDVLAIGTDFDGIDPHIQLQNASMIPQLFSAMKDAGFTEEEIQKIAYQNFLRVLKSNL